MRLQNGLMFAIVLGAIPLIVVISATALISTGGATSAATSVSTAHSPPTTISSSTQSPSSGGTSVISIEAVTSSGTPLDREGYNMFMQLLQNNQVIGSCNAPCQFTVHDGQTYQINPGNWGGETFSHW
jgi:hypothetical protein